MADISIAELVAPFRIKVDKLALAKVDEVLEKYSNKKIVQTVKESKGVSDLAKAETKLEKQRAKAAKDKELADKRAFAALVKQAHFENKEFDLKKKRAYFENKEFDVKRRQQQALIKQQEAAWMRNTRPRLVNGDTFEERLSRQLKKSGLRQTKDGKITRDDEGGSGTTTGQRALGLGRRSIGASYHGVMAGTGILTGFGLYALNRRLAEMQSAQVGLSTVAGSPEEYNKQRAFLRQLGGSIGATQAELVPEYTKFFANAQGTALEPYAQTGFASLTKYGKVLGLDQESMKGTFRAVSQMVN